MRSKKLIKAVSFLRSVSLTRQSAIASAWILLMLLVMPSLSSTSPTTNMDQGLIESETNNFAYARKSNYDSNEIVEIIVRYSDPETALEISDGKQSYSFLGQLQNKIEFWPKSSGKYTIRLFSKSGEKLHQSEFYVGLLSESIQKEQVSGKQPSLDKPTLKTDQRVYSIAEKVRIEALQAPDEFKLEITYVGNGKESASYHFLGSPKGEIAFSPQKEGLYIVSAYDLESNMIAQAEFLVGESQAGIIDSPQTEMVDTDTSVQVMPQGDGAHTPASLATDIGQSEQEALGIRILGTGNTQKSATVKIINKNSKSPLPLANDSSDLITSQGGIADIEYIRSEVTSAGTDGSLSRLPVDKIVLHEVNLSTRSTLKTDYLKDATEVAKALGLQRSQHIKNSFYIDPMLANAESGYFEFRAKGNALYKCAVFDSASLACHDTWKKIMDLKPGNIYRVDFTANDPAYAEVGISTINTEKDVYRIGETATIIVGAIDRLGFPAPQAEIVLSITSPSGEVTTLRSSDQSLDRIGNGEFIAYYNQIIEAGSYIMNVSSEVNGEVSEYSSSFDAFHSNKFEISRFAPTVINPWHGPQKTRIKIRDFGLDGQFAFTEKLPASVLVISAGPGAVIESENFTYITWSGLSDQAELEYLSLAPKITPDIISIGPATIDQLGKTYAEQREWIMLLDAPITIILNETHTANLAVANSNITLGAKDGTENTATITVPASSSDTRIINANTTSSKFAGPILISSGTNFVFAGTFSSDRASQQFIKWEIQEVNSTGSIFICNSSEVNIGATNNVRFNLTGSCNVNRDVFILLNETLRMIVHDRNARAQAVTVTNFFDSTGTTSWLNLTATVLGNLSTDITTPSSNTSEELGGPITAQCEVNCTGGDCLSTEVAIQINTSANSWTNINSTNGKIILSAGSNPQSIGTLIGTTTRTFSLTANEVNNTKLRCDATSTYSSQSGEKHLQINITAPNSVPVIEWVTDGPSSNITPTQQPNDVYFSINATDLNNDQYYLLVCETNSTTAGACTDTQICVSGSVAPGTNVTCSKSTSGLSGPKPWYAFACDGIGCSVGTNWSGVNGSPYYVNNIPSLGSVASNDSVVRIGDYISILTSGTSDQENHSLALTCGNASGTYNMCTGAYGYFSRSCLISIPWSDDASHTIYCAVNDSFGMSTESTVAVTADNTAPTLGTPKSNDTDSIIRSSEWIRLNISATDTHAIVNVTVANNTRRGLSVIGATNFYEINTTLSLLGCTAQDGNCSLEFQAEDEAGNVASSFMQITIDDLPPQLSDAKVNDSDHIVRKNTPIQINVTTSDTNSVINVTLRNTTIVQMGPNDAGLWQVNTTLNTLGCTALDGNCTLVFYATDVAGNINGTFALALTIDEVPPSVSGPQANRSVTRKSDSIRLNLSASDTNNVTRVVAYNNSAIELARTPTPNVWEVNTTLDALGCTATNGLCSISFNATDQDANTNNSVSLGITVDELPPMISAANVNDTDKIARSAVILNFNVSTSDTNALLNVSLGNSTKVTMSRIGASTIYELNASLSQLGCIQTDSNCTLVFTAIDEAFNVNTTELSITVDDVQPAISSPQVNDTDRILRKSDPIRINISTTDTNIITNVTVQNITVVQMWQTSADGIYEANTTLAALGCTQTDSNCTLIFYSYDVAGNSNSTSMQITVDEVAPQILNKTINKSNMAIRSAMSINFTVNASDTNSIAEVKLGQFGMSLAGTVWNLAKSASDFGCLEGTCIIYINATDTAGNTNSSEYFNLTVDDSVPAISLNLPLNNTNFSTQSVTLNFTATDNLDTQLSCNVTLDSLVNNTLPIIAQNGTSINYSVDGLAEGTHSWNVSCFDDVPNSNNSATFIFKIDLTAPTVFLVSPANNTLEESTNEIVFIYNASDSVTLIDNCSLLINGTQNGATDFTVANSTLQNFTRTLVNGIYSWNITCLDSVGRETTTSPFNLTVNNIIDTEPPSITLQTPLQDHYSSLASLSFYYTIVDALSNISNCSLIINNAVNRTNQSFVNESATNNFTVTGFNDGIYNWTINCTDNSIYNNSGTASNGPRNFTADTNAPGQFGLIAPSNNTILRNISPLFRWEPSIESNFANYTLQIDDEISFASANYSNNTFSSSSTNISVEIGSDTKWYWKVTAYDLAGNSRESNGYFVYTTDNTMPNVTLLSPSSGSWNSSQSIQFSYTSFDLYIRNCSLYHNATGVWHENATNSTPSNSTTNYFASALPQGVLEWNIRCFDNASNNAFAQQNFSLYIDSGAPSVSLNYPGNDSNLTSTSINFNFSSQENLAPSSNCSLIFDGLVNSSGINASATQSTNHTLANINQGFHNWSINCTDLAFNSGLSLTYYFLMDSTEPLVNITSPPNNTVLSAPGTVEFAYNTSDSSSGVKNCTLILNTAANKTNSSITPNTNISFNLYLDPGNYNWSVNCSDHAGNTGKSGTFSLEVEPPKFTQTISPSFGTEIDRDAVSSTVADNASLIVYLTDDAQGVLVTFKANLTDPVIAGQTVRTLGTSSSNSTGYTRLNFSGRQNDGQKIYAGNYTWWAEASGYIINTTSTILVYGGLNVSFRFTGELPDPFYGQDDIAVVHEFLKSKGPESDSNINFSYAGSVNTTFAMSNGTNFTIQLVDPEIGHEQSDLNRRISENYRARQSQSHTESSIQQHKIYSTTMHNGRNYVVEDTMQYTDGIWHSVSSRRLVVEPHYTGSRPVLIEHADAPVKLMVLNLKKSSYMPSESAEIFIGITDERAMPISNADFSLELRIADKVRAIAAKPKEYSPGSYKATIHLPSEHVMESNIEQAEIVAIYGDSEIRKEIVIDHEPKLIMERQAPVVVNPQDKIFTSKISIVDKDKGLNGAVLREFLPEETKIFSTDAIRSVLEKSNTGNLGKWLVLEWHNISSNFTGTYKVISEHLPKGIFEMGPLQIITAQSPKKTIEGMIWQLIVDPSPTFILNETSTASFTTINNNITFGARDAAINNVSVSLASGAANQVMLRINSTNATFPGRLLISSGTVFNFTGTFMRSGASVFTKWSIEKINNTLTTICNSTEIEIATANNVKQNRTSACNSPSDIIIEENDRLRVIIYGRNGAGAARTFTHFWDTAETRSFTNFTASVIGVLSTNLTSPTTPQTRTEGDLFTATCDYNCTRGSCLNTNIHIQVNSSDNDWIDINITDGFIRLWTGQTNPVSVGEVTETTGSSTTFSLNASVASSRKIRCVGNSSYSNKTGDQETVINIRAPNSAPVFILGPGDGNSSASFPTQSPNNVNFTATATDANLDQYSLKVCSINASNPITCDGQSICASGFVASGSLASCAVSTSSKSGNYTWFAFVCDDYASACSPASQGTGNDSSPYYVNNNPTVSSLSAIPSTVKYNDTINITALGSSDSENDTMRVECGNASGLANLCIGEYDYGNRSCIFSWPYSDDISHDVFCRLNDSFSLSSEVSTSPLSDNTPPQINLSLPLHLYNSTSTAVTFYYVASLGPLSTCQLYGNFDGTFRANSTAISPAANTNNSFGPLTFNEGIYTWNVRCNDTLGNHNFSTLNRTFKIDTTAPSVNLQSPSNDYTESSSSNIDFIFDTTDATSDVANCSLIINEKVNGSALSPIVEGAPQQITRTLADGTYNWSINCTDPLGNTGNSSRRNITLQVADLAPEVTLVSPQEGTHTNLVNATFTYNVTDDKGLKNCSLLIDGIINASNASIVNLTETNEINTSYLQQGVHNWTVMCIDKSENIDTAANITFTIDLTAPVVSLVSPSNNSIYNISDRVLFQYNVSDAFGPNSAQNCSIFVNSTLGQTNSQIALNSTQTFTEVLSNGFYEWNVGCYDTAGNNMTSSTFYVTVNSSLKLWNGTFNLSSKSEGLWNVSSRASARWFFPVATISTRNLTLDLSAPNLTLLAPANNTNTTNRTLLFEYDANETLSNISSCILIVDQSAVMTNYTVRNGRNNFTYTLDYGTHVWSVNCTDHVGNVGYSQTFNLTIKFKDLMINSSLITFSNTSPHELQNITIFATVRNIGDENVDSPFNVKLNLDSGSGAQIGETFLVTSLDANQSTTLNTTWLAVIGTHYIVASVDIPVESEGVIEEKNESNNLANASIQVGIYNYYYGLSTVDIVLTTADNLTISAWYNSSAGGGNIYIADTESPISWTSLKAISRNLTDSFRIDDFSEIDTALNTSIFDDSINRTWLSDGIVIGVDSFTIFGISVSNVPVVNSTNSTTFRTGILWDSSDVNTGEYNGSQDIVFVTKINAANPGKYGLSDFEFKVPSRLKQLVQPIESVSFYAELE